MNTKMQTKKAKRGFTITELVIVIAVIAILAAVLIPTFSNVIKRANESAAMQEAKSEWDNFSPEAAISGESNRNFLIVYQNEQEDEQNFVVINGAFDPNAVAEPTGTSLTYNGTTYTVASQDVTTMTETGGEDGAKVYDYSYANSHIKIFVLTPPANQGN